MAAETHTSRKYVKILAKKNKICPYRHPRICRYGEICMFLTRCSCKHKTSVTTSQSEMAN